MKAIRMLKMSIRDSFKSVIRNYKLSLASISCITITLIIVAIAIIASINVQNFTKEIERDLTIVVFMDTNTTKEDIEKIKEKFDNVSNIDTYTYKSKIEVKEEMQAESDVFNTVLSNWDEDESPLKDTFQIKVKEVEKIGKTAEKIKNMDNVSVVRYGEGMVEKLISAFSSIEKVTYIIVIALILVTVFLIVNTIELTISARSREIGIMRLVGASNWTIKTPFVIEGMILGLFGSIIPILITTYGYTAFYEHFDGYLFSELIQLIKPEPFIYQASLAIMIIGVIVGMIGSSFAVRKYLKV